MFNVIHKSGYDIISGSSGNEKSMDWNSYGRFFVQSGSNGVCVDQMHGSYGALPQFPKCFVRDLVINFFIGRTLEVSKVRFDPAFKRTGHVHYFIDALRNLRIAYCPELYTLNDPGHCDPTHWHKDQRTDLCHQYAQGRYPPQVWTRTGVIKILQNQGITLKMIQKIKKKNYKLP